MIKNTFSTKGDRFKGVSEFIHKDVCGPLNVRVREGFDPIEVSNTSLVTLMSIYWIIGFHPSCQHHVRLSRIVLLKEEN